MRIRRMSTWTTGLNLGDGLGTYRKLCSLLQALRRPRQIVGSRFNSTTEAQPNNNWGLGTGLDWIGVNANVDMDVDVN